MIDIPAPTLEERLKASGMTDEECAEELRKRAAEALSDLKKHQAKIGELYDADPNCWHVLDPRCMSGVRCTKCPGWFCH